MATRAYHSPRRDQAAAQTRGAILDAAEELFAAHGYAQTSVGEVARAARVAPNTVYTSVGGKPQLLLALVERAMSDPAIQRSLDAIEAATDPAEAVRLLAAGTSLVMRRQLRVITLIADNASADPLIAQAARRADAVYRERIDAVAQRLAALGALHGMTKRQAGDVLWFYFGTEAWRSVRSIGWGWDRATAWLAQQASAALLSN